MINTANKKILRDVFCVVRSSQHKNAPNFGVESNDRFIANVKLAGFVFED